MKYLLLLLLVFNFSCGTDGGDPIFSNSSVIYGDDDRVFTHESPDEMLRALARSTFAMVDKDLINRFGYDAVKISGDRTTFCPGEPFYDSILAPTCSGFLVAPDLLVTAGHCVNSYDACEKQKWVLDFKDDSRRDGMGVILDQDKIYHCQQIILKKFTGVDTKDVDFAIIRLTRKVRDRIPLKFRTEGKIPDLAETAILGHPIGLPQIITPFARIMENDAKKRFYQDADAFGGNSGGAVVNMDSGVVEGILVTNLQGMDFVKDEQRRCLKMGRITEIGGAPTAGVYRITEISDYLSGLIGTSLLGTNNYPKNYWQRLFSEDETKLKKLIRKGLDVNFINDRGESLLHWAVKKEKVNLVKYLLEYGAKLNYKDHYKETPLFYAARVGNNEIAKMLIYQGAKVNLRNRDKAVVLHVASRTGNTELIKFLLRDGANINVLDFDKNTPLKYAATHGQLETVKFLLKMPKIKVTSSNKFGVSPLLEAAYKGYTEIFKLLINHPQTWNINEQDKDGSTPLIFAAAKGNIEIVRILLRHPEIEVNKPNHYDQNALFWARKKGHREVERLLIYAGAR